MKAEQIFGTGRFIKKILLTLGICFCVIGYCNAIPQYDPIKDSTVTSTQQQAIAFVEEIKELSPSEFWPNIKPVLFLENLKINIHQPESIYPGLGTNFCGYAALTYLFLQDDPLGYAKLILQLYREGKVEFGNAIFKPSSSIKKEAGLLKYKGILDIHPADQMWFLCLADHFKGYLNFFNHKYNPGDENTFWASVNYAKFNRMVRKLLRYHVSAKGADFFRPRVGDLYQFISEKMKTGPVVLYINNRIVHKKNQVTIKLGVPTHYIVVKSIIEENNIVTLVYWDYGGKTLLQLSPAFLKRIIFGITWLTKKQNDAE